MFSAEKPENTEMFGVGTTFVAVKFPSPFPMENVESRHFFIGIMCGFAKKS